jgi:hypothetical protein
MPLFKQPQPLLRKGERQRTFSRNMLDYLIIETHFASLKD